jgi:hypothetical protein
MEVTYSRSLCDHDDTILFRVDWERPSINPEEVQLLCVEIMRSPPCPRIHSFIHQGSVKARHVASSSAASSGAVHRYLSSCEQSTNALRSAHPIVMHIYSLDRDSRWQRHNASLVLLFPCLRDMLRYYSFFLFTDTLYWLVDDVHKNVCSLMEIKSVCAGL